jgi:hypothetical protein
VLGVQRLLGLAEARAAVALVAKSRRQLVAAGIAMKLVLGAPMLLSLRAKRTGAIRRREDAQSHPGKRHYVAFYSRSAVRDGAS